MNASAALALSACGGGGGGSDPPSQPANPPPANTAPTSVSAGADQTITLPTNSVQLQGSASDDGLPAPATLTYSWSAGGGSGVTFSAASSAATTATFASAGTYTLTLTVSDGSLSSTDTVQVIVNAASGGTAPTVSAGADQTIELPFTASLQGSATTTVTPAPTLTYAWTGPAGVTFASASSATTEATFASTGSFELTLTVSDGTTSASDAVAITVNPAMFPAMSDDTVADQGWTRVTAAADVGMTQAGLDQAATYAQSGAAGPGSGMIVRRGRIVHSWGNIDERFDLKSTTKSIGGVALGLAIDGGLLALSDAAITRLPTIGTPPAENANTGWLDDITILQLATHTAGFQKPGGFIPLQFQPGTTWSYSDGGLNWLADLLTFVNNRDLRDLMEERVWSVIGLTRDDIVWRAQAAGTRPEVRPPDAIDHRELASGIIANTNAMARVGLLFLRRGVWAQQPRILSESFIDMVRVPHTEVSNPSVQLPDAANFPNATQHYGVLWWTNADGALPNVPRDAYWGWGLGDSLIVVIPSLDLVIARAGPQVATASTGRVWNDSDWNGDYAVLGPLLDPIVASVTP